MADTERFPGFERTCREFNLTEFERFLLELTLSAELDERVSWEFSQMGGDTLPTLSLALRLFTQSDDEYYRLLFDTMRRENVLYSIFNADFGDIRKSITLVPAVKRFIVGADERLRYGMGAHAKLIPAVFGWDDIILPQSQKQALKSACNQVRYRDIVYEKWGFGAKLPYGRGIRMLFTGPPGTGKTMAAQVIANDLGLDLYRVDVSALVSKYIGETEKHISALFDSANDCVLFFDEADSLFGKRGEQKDSHDRYSNLQISYLLQRFEDHDGVVVLSTNLARNFDTAFGRRMQCRIDFLMPDAQLRRRLWESFMMPPVPVSQDVDAGFLAERFELSGASIKNIMLNAAFAAAAAGTSIGTAEIMDALRGEYTKLNRVADV